MTPTFTIALGSLVDGTRGTSLFLNFRKAGGQQEPLADQKGVGDPTAPLSSATGGAGAG